MGKRVSLLVVAVLLVSASSSALSISAVNKVSEYEDIQAEGERKRKLRVNDEAIGNSHDERTRLPISMRESSPELHTGTIPNSRINALARVNAVAKSYQDRIDITPDMIRRSMEKLLKRLDTFDMDDEKVFLMAIGNVYFKSPSLSDRNYRGPHGPKVFKEELGLTLYETWRKLLLDSGYQPIRVFEKMRVLRNDNIYLNMDLEEYAYMAMGSEILSKMSGSPRRVPILPSSKLLKRMSKQRGVDVSKSKQWLERLATDERYKKKSYEELVMLATRRAMGEELTLG